MCFSTGASFTAGAVLFSVGVASMAHSATRAQRLLACVPLVFGFQQCSEGIVWLGLSNPGYAFLRNAATYTFLAIAQVVWPLLLPLAVWMLETVPRRKKILSRLFGVGVLAAASQLFCLLSYNVSANIDCYHIQYVTAYPEPSIRHLLGILYLIPTIIPPMLSGHRKLRLLGLVLLFSLLVARVFYSQYFISVWCFFATIISLVVFSAITSLNRSKAPVPAVRL